MAIAFDVAANTGSTYWNNGAHTSMTLAHTTTGTDRFLIVGIILYSPIARTVTGVTYNGVAMTSIGSITAALEGNNQNTSLWYLANPATGANNIIASMSGAVAYVSAVSASYTGVNQSNPLDSSNTGQNTSAASSFSIATTVVASDCWLVGTGWDRDTNITAGANTTIRTTNAASIHAMADSNAIVATGSQSLAYASSTSNTWPGAVIASIAPAVAASTNSNFFQFM